LVEPQSWPSGDSRTTGPSGLAAAGQASAALGGGTAARLAESQSAAHHSVEQAPQMLSGLSLPGQCADLLQQAARFQARALPLAA